MADRRSRHADQEDVDAMIEIDEGRGPGIVVVGLGPALVRALALATVIVATAVAEETRAPAAAASPSPRTTVEGNPGVLRIVRARVVQKAAPNLVHARRANDLRWNGIIICLNSYAIRIRHRVFNVIAQYNSLFSSFSNHLRLDFCYDSVARFRGACFTHFTNGVS